MKFQFTLDREPPIVVTVKGACLHACEGVRNRGGVQEEPDEPAYFEIEDITDGRGNPVDVTDEECDQMERAAMEE